MQIDKLKQFYEGSKRDGIIFSFCGPLSQGILEGIGETVRKKMQLEYTGMGTIQRVFSILVEQAQNILRYSAETTEMPDVEDVAIRSGILILGIKDNRYNVCCGNYMPLDKVEKLARELAAIRDMTPEALKQLYKERRRAAPPSGSVGAGLGLLEIARRSTEPISFDMQPVDEAFAFFSIKAVI
jgi:hypothetical protein